MTIAWYDPTNHHVSTDKHDPRFTPLGQLWPLDVKRPWVDLTDDDCKGMSAGDILVAMWVSRILKEKNT